MSAPRPAKQRCALPVELLAVLAATAAVARLAPAAAEEGPCASALAGAFVGLDNVTNRFVIHGGPGNHVDIYGLLSING